MAVTLEWCEGAVFVARSGESHSVHGDPYDLACTVECHGTEATAKGITASRPISSRDIKGLMDGLRDHGIRTLRIERIKDGVVSEQVWSID